MKKNEMTRYIDAAKLIKLVKEQVEDEDDIEDIIYLINETPTEVPYCCNCGAKMEGDKNEKKVL